MANSLDWRKYVDENGDFELGNYIYTVILDLMKMSLDMGTMISDDNKKLMSYKEQVKKNFKGKWYDIAEVFEFFDLLVPCGCSRNEFCRICGGSRYRLNAAMAPDKLQEIALVTSKGQSDKFKDKLMEGLDQAIDEVLDLGVTPLAVNHEGEKIEIAQDTEE